METTTIPQTSTDILPDDQKKIGNFEVIIVVIQALLFTFLVYLQYNTYRSVWYRITIAALVSFEFSILVTGLGLFLGFRGDDPEYKYDK